MALRRMRYLSAAGDTQIAEYDVEVISDERLREIEKEFNDRVAKGWIAADITDRRDVLIKEFDPSADILFIPGVHGGRA